MGTFLGYVSIINNHYNFRPIAKIEGTSITSLTKDDQVALLPESNKRDIEFVFSYEDKNQVERTFCETSLVLFDFELPDLDDSIDPSTNQRRLTGYKVQVIDMLESGKIRPIHADNIYHVIQQEDIISNFYNDNVVDINVSSITEGEKVFVHLDGFLAGPYTIGYRELTSSFWNKPQIKENKYTIRGYKDGDYALQELNYSEYWNQEYKWKIFVPKQDMSVTQRDVITDEILIEGFRDSLTNGLATNGFVSIDDVPALVARYKNALLSGDILAENVRRSRLNHLVEILTSEKDIDDTLSTITDFICDLLIRQKDSQNVEEWLRELLEKHPELIEQLKDSRAVTEKIDEIKQDLANLLQQRADLEEEIERKQNEAEEIDRAAIEAKKTELLQMDAKYADLRAKLETAEKTLGVIEDISDLQKKQAYYKDDIDYLEKHRDRLKNETKDFELQFQQLINNPHEKMVGIAFDGFMSSKMLHAAAQWEAEEAAQQDEELLAKVNGIPTIEKTPEELVEYLCRAVQIVRPTYNKNTIVNIAICLTQGFLTVFSGEPGCGKTSICNIFGEVLGLNKIAECVDCEKELTDSIKRYVPVSVERGWTTKRDFVGYFNPLSKTFDKSNRRVYDALHQLDIEKRDGVCKFPYVILLDEANLSPMEYYWSDFMNICDDLDSQSKVNLGENYIFSIPETLHFLATINNDHTTETLSPRLIDRAWIISLPQQANTTMLDERIPSEQIEIISWASLRKAFIPKKEECTFSGFGEIQRIYDAVIKKLGEKRFSVSYRIDKAIKRYWAAASKNFEMDETKTDVQTVALDYAVVQRILPKIVGNGEAFEKWLDEFRSLCSNHGLNMSAKVLKDIIDRGNQQMKYYQFFC